MGAAKIVSVIGDGQYTIERQIAGLDQALTYLADKRALLETGPTSLASWRNAIAQQWDVVQVARATVDAMIADWMRGGFVEYAELPTVRSTPTQSDKDEVLRLVNQIREDNNLPPLTESPQLANAAQQQADWMGQNTVGHDGADGSRPVDRIRAAGYNPAVAAENVAAGQSTPAQVVASWMKSPGHRANILNPDITEIGIGGGTGDDYGRTWVQNFGKPHG